MKERVEQMIKSYIPMSEPSFLLLSALIKPTHGYGIMQNVSELTQKRVNLGAGTVYTILYKMEQDGLIAVVDEKDRRKIYLITPLGMEVLRIECLRIEEMAQIAFFTKSSIDKKPAVV